MNDVNLIEVQYEQIPIINGKVDEEAMEKLNVLLTIYKDGNVIYLCHPKHLFEHYVENKETKEISMVDWNGIDINRMFHVNDYGHFSMVEQCYSSGRYNYQYLRKKSSHMMRKYLSEGKVEMVYPFVVLEEIYNSSDNTSEYFVRGMICCNQDGFQIAFNPKNDKKVLHESVWEKGLRMGDNYDILSRL